MKKSSNRSRRIQSGRQKTVSNRILILALAIVTLFTVLLVRLVDLQAVQHTAYVEKQDDYTSIKQYTSAPRGQIYDSAGNVLAKTVPSHNIVYTAPNNATYEDSLIYADRVGTVFHMTKEDFSLSELKDAYLRMLSMLDANDPAYNGMNLLTQQERDAYANGEITSSKVRQIQLANINEDLINEVDERALIAAAVYDRMAENASTGQASVI